MSAQHTPGPWFAAWGESSSPDRILLQSESGIDVAEAFYTNDQKGCHTGNARLIAAAPDLLAALTELADVFAHDCENSVARFDRLAAMFRKDTGYTAPGKDSAAGPVAQADREELNAIYDAWYLAKVTRARAAIAKATGQ